MNGRESVNVWPELFFSSVGVAEVSTLIFFGVQSTGWDRDTRVISGYGAILFLSYTLFLYKHNVYKHNQPEILFFLNTLLNTSQPQVFEFFLKIFLTLAFSKQKLVYKIYICFFQ